MAVSTKSTSSLRDRENELDMQWAFSAGTEDGLEDLWLAKLTEVQDELDNRGERIIRRQTAPAHMLLCELY